MRKLENSHFAFFYKIMDINWYGQSMFRFKGKTTTVVIDPYNPQMLGLKPLKEIESSLVLVSHHHPDHDYVQAVVDHPMIIDGPGEYEISGISIIGVQTYHDMNKGAQRGTNTVYNVEIDGINVVHLGDLGHILSEEDISGIGNVDILLIPVGGNYTINAEDAAKIVAQLEPKIVIPMHYKFDDLKLEIDSVEPFLKEMGVEGLTPSPKLTISREKLPGETQVILLSKSS